MGIGLFGRDDQQDERMDQLENHIRALTELVQQNQLDMAAIRIDLMGLQAHVNEKLSAADFDSHCDRRTPRFADPPARRPVVFVCCRDPIAVS